MNPQVQGTSSSSPADPPLKRKRGRPRKDESLVSGENMPVSDNVKKNKQWVGTTDVVSGDMVGQVVSGVIEGSFDAGYLLKVKVGNTDTYLRGVVFLPGRFTPITATNDVAPQAKQYKRTEMPIPVPNPPPQFPGSVPSLEQSDRHSIELKKLAPTVQPSELQYTVSIVQENQSASSLLPSTENLPMSSTVPSFGGKEIPQQILEPGLKSQSASVRAQTGPDKVFERDELLREFDTSIRKGTNADVEAKEQLKPVPLSAPSAEILPGIEPVNLDLQIQHQAASYDPEPSQLVHDVVKSPNIEHNRAPIITEPGIMSSEPVGINSWMEKQDSPKKAGPLELAMKIISGDGTSQLNENPGSHDANIHEAGSQSTPLTSLPVTLFERETIPSAPTIATEVSSLQIMIEPQFCKSSSSTSIMKADSGPALVTNLPAALFDGEAIPSESKLANDGPVHRMTELQFCSSSGVANNTDCSIKNVIPPTDS